jgi:hypothetical protein
MEPFVESIYLEELKTQCEWALAAVHGLNQSLASKEAKSIADFFRQAAALLQHAGLASKLLWPPGSPIGFKNKRAKSRSRHLRGTLGIEDSHPLKNRSLRDHFEHYDERLDDWLVNSPNHIFVNNVIGPRTIIGGNVVKDQDIIKLFNPATKELVFRGEPYNVQELVDAVSDVLRRVVERLQVIEHERYSR